MVMVRAVLTVMDRFFVVVPMPSLAWTVKLEVPAVVGVPVIAPVEALSDSPAGNDPVVMDQV